MKWALVAAIGCGLVTAGCGSNRGEAYKARLMGTWVSDHQRYEGCTMTISQGRLIFETASGHVTLIHIGDIHYREVNGAHLLELDMLEGGEPAYTMYFFLEASAEGDILRFKNQRDVIWHHADGT